MARSCLVLLTLVAAAVLASPAAATPPGGNGRLAFVGAADPRAPWRGPWHVWTVNPDGTGATKITAGSRRPPWSLAWSPDGERLAVAVPRPRSSEHELPLHWAIVVMDADGANARQVHTFAGFFPALSWSPDGNRIAYPGLTRSSFQIFSVRADGGDRVQHTSFRYTLVFAPSWSPDGTRFAFNGDFTPARDDRWPLWTIAADGTDRKRLTRTDSVGADWSPDGTRVATLTAGGLRAVRSDGTGSTLVLGDDDAIGWLPVWSPDGTRLALPDARWSGEDDPEATLLGTVNEDGTCPMALLRRDAWAPAWQPVPGGAASPPNACANVAVRSEADDAFALARHPFFLRDVVENRGTEPAPGSLLIHRMPRGWTVLSADSTRGLCSGTAPVRCELGTLAPRERATVTIGVRVPRGTPPWAPQGHVSAATSADDPDPTDDATRQVSIQVCDRLGTDHRELLIGSRGADVICGRGGNDRILGLGGDDIILAGAGGDRVWAGPGNDFVLGERGHDVLRGGDGHDWLEDGPGLDRLYGGRGDDGFWALDGRRDFLHGGPGRDYAFHDRFDVVRSVEGGDYGLRTAREGAAPAAARTANRPAPRDARRELRRAVAALRPDWGS